ncbi:MAG: 6-pyruvoyl trahydropterin synthase family protein [Planctomycetota bacterium]
MGHHRASKFIDFCYGHRIPGHAGKCRNLHGHNARVEIECAGPLDELGMVVDFLEIKRVVSAWIDEHWDHRMILSRGDPLVGVLREKGEPVYELDGPTTAENLARHVFEVARDAGLPVSAVRFWETPDSVAGYSDE